MGLRIAAFLIDIALSALVAWLFTRPEAPKNLSLYIWAAMTAVLVGVFGATPGQGVLGMRVASTRGRGFIGWWAIPRTVLVFLIVPPLVTDRDGRGWHDRLCRTVVLRTR